MPPGGAKLDSFACPAKAAPRTLASPFCRRRTRRLAPSSTRCSSSCERYHHWSPLSLATLPVAMRLRQQLLQQQQRMLSFARCGWTLWQTREPRSWSW